MIEVHTWQVVTFFISTLLTVLGLFVGAGKMLLAQFDAKLNERFRGADKHREMQIGGLSDKFLEMQDKVTRAEETARQATTQLLEFKSQLPLHYVRRDDYIRGQAVLEAKLDAVFAKIETIQLQRSNSND